MAKRAAKSSTSEYGCIEQFREALTGLEEGSRVCGSEYGSSLVAMFDDIAAQWQNTLKTLHDTEDQFLLLALKTQKMQKQYMGLKNDALGSREELLSLKKEQRAWEKRKAVYIQDISKHQRREAELQSEVEDLQEVVELCKGVIMDNDNDVPINTEDKNRLIRVCSRSNSLRKARPQARLRRLEETVESSGGSEDEEFDNTDDNILDG